MRRPPEIVRTRALKGRLRAAQGSPRALSAAIDLAPSLARDERAPAGVRVAAFHGLAVQGEAPAKEISGQIVKGAENDGLVRAVASELSTVRWRRAVVAWPRVDRRPASL